MYQNTRKNCALRNLGVFFTILSFSVTTFTPPHAWAAPIQTPSTVIPGNIQADLTAIPLSDEIGTVRDIYRGNNSKLVVLIEDAHSIPAAQKNIQSIIHFFQSRYGIQTVFTEGAVSQLDPQIFLSFPDSERLHSVMQTYMEQGELTGVNAAALTSGIRDKGKGISEKESPIPYPLPPNPYPLLPIYFSGMEDWPLYEKGIAAYQKAMFHKDRLMTTIRQQMAESRKQKEKIYSKELLDVDQALHTFDEDQSSILDLLSTLAKYQPPKEYPALMALLQQSIDHSPQTIDKQSQEIKRIAAKVEKTLSPVGNGRDRSLRQEIREFNRKWQEFSTSQISPEAFALYLKELAHRLGLEIKIPESLQSGIQREETIRDIRGTELFRDLERYTHAVSQSLLRTPEEKTLYEQSQRLKLLSRLAELKLTQEDWKKIKRMTQSAERIEHSKSDLYEKQSYDAMRYAPSAMLQEHIRFYEIAEERNGVFIEKIDHKISDLRSQMPDQNSRPSDIWNLTSAICVAGGFHTEGLTQLLKSSGTSYVLVMPKIQEFPAEDLYPRHMQGDVSWKNYFRAEKGQVNLYDAFVRATRDQLISGIRDKGKGISEKYSSTPYPLTPIPYPLPPAPLILKHWRDQILRDLAAQGRISQAGQYTRFIDEITPQSAWRIAHGETRDRSERFALSALRSAWLSAIDRFGAGLKQLRRGLSPSGTVPARLTRENILDLIHTVTATSSAQVLSGALDPNAWTDAKILNPITDSRPQISAELMPSPTQRSEGFDFAQPESPERGVAPSRRAEVRAQKGKPEINQDKNEPPAVDQVPIRMRLQEAYANARKTRTSQSVDITGFSGIKNNLLNIKHPAGRILRLGIVNTQRLSEFILPDGTTQLFNVDAQLERFARDTAIPDENIDAQLQGQGLFRGEKFDVLRAVVSYSGDDKWNVVFVGYKKDSKGRLRKIDRSDTWMATPRAFIFRSFYSHSQVLREYIANEPEVGKEIEITDFQGIDLDHAKIKEMSLPNGMLWKNESLGFDEHSLARIFMRFEKSNSHWRIIFRAVRINSEGKEEDVEVQSVWDLVSFNQIKKASNAINNEAYEKRLAKLYGVREGEVQEIALSHYEHVELKGSQVILRPGFLLPDGSRLSQSMTLGTKKDRANPSGFLRLQSRIENGQLTLNVIWSYSSIPFAQTYPPTKQKTFSQDASDHSMDFQMRWDGKVWVEEDLCSLQEREMRWAFKVREGEVKTIALRHGKDVNFDEGAILPGMVRPDGTYLIQKELLLFPAPGPYKDITAAFTRKNGVLQVTYTASVIDKPFKETYSFQSIMIWNEEQHEWIPSIDPARHLFESALQEAYQVKEGERKTVRLTRYAGVDENNKNLNGTFLLPEGKRLSRVMDIASWYFHGDRIADLDAEILREDGVLYIDFVRYLSDAPDKPGIRNPKIFRYRISNGTLEFHEQVEDTPRGRVLHHFKQFFRSKETRMHEDHVGLLVDERGICALPVPGGSYQKSRMVSLRGGTDLGRVTVDAEQDGKGNVRYVVRSYKKSGHLAAITRFEWTDGRLKYLGREDGREIEEREHKAQEKSNTEKIDLQLNLLLENIPAESICAFSARYSLDLKNILWGMVGVNLEGHYSEEEILALIDQRMFAFLEKNLDDEERRINLPQGTGSAGTDQGLQWFELNINQEQIQKMAELIDQRLPPAPAEPGQEHTLAAVARRQALTFIQKLEEKYFFKEFYSDASGTNMVEQARTAIEQAKAAVTPGSLFYQALDSVLQDVNAAIALKDQLLKEGIRSSTHWNLYQLVGVLRLHRLERAILGDEMGLGKTWETLATFLHSGEPEMLVVAPNQVLGRWMEDIAQHTDAPLEVVLLAREVPVDKLGKDSRIQVTTFSDSKSRYEYLLNHRPRPPDGRRRIIIMNQESLPFFHNHREKLSKERKAARESAAHPPAHPPQAATDPKAVELKPEDWIEVSVPFLAVDEAHLMKSEDALRSIALFGDRRSGAGACKARYKIIATGTPLENEVSDIFGYLKFLALDGTTKEELFFKDLDTSSFESIFRPENLGKIALLHGYLAERMVRRLSDDVIKGLPKKIIHVVKLDPIQMTMTIDGGEPIPIPGDYRLQVELMREALENPQEFEEQYGKNLSSATDGKETIVRRKRSSAQITRLEQVGIGPQVFGMRADSIKFKALEVLLEQHLNAGQSVLGFSTYKSATRTAKVTLDAKLAKDYPEGDPRRKVGYLDGDLDTSERPAEIDDFQKGEARTLLATSGVAGIGINLTQAEVQIHMNWPWKPSTFDQMVGRSRRIDPDRNKPGRELHVYVLEMHVGVSVDAVKRKIIRLKQILNEMVTNGNLSPEILKVLDSLDTRAIDLVREEALPSPEKMDLYELSTVQKLQTLLHQALHQSDPEKAKALWNQISFLYAKIILRKASFFGNVANLVHLSDAHAFPTLQGAADKPKKGLDVGAGPSTAKRAYFFDKETLNQKGLFLEITDLDASPGMLQQGLAEGGQILGSLDGIDELPSDRWDWVNLSLAYRFSQSPADFLIHVRRILKDGGIFSMILPAHNILDQNFLDAVHQLGFQVMTPAGGYLESKLDPATYERLVAQYGKEVAEDMAQRAHGKFTYLVARKEGAPTTGLDLRELNKKLYRKMDLPTLDEAKAKRIQKERGGLFGIPDGGHIISRVAGGQPAGAWETRLHVELNPVLRAVEFLERGLYLLEIMIKRGNGGKRFKNQPTLRIDVFDQVLALDENNMDLSLRKKLIADLHKFTADPDMTAWLQDQPSYQEKIAALISKLALEPIEENGDAVIEEEENTVPPQPEARSEVRNFDERERVQVTHPRMKELTGKDSLVLLQPRPGSDEQAVYHPRDDYHYSIQFAEAAADQISRMASEFKDKEFNVFVKGSGSGLDALTVLYHALKKHGLKKVSIDITDTNPLAIETTNENIRDYKNLPGVSIHSTVNAGFPDGSKKYHLVLFNAGDVIENPVLDSTKQMAVKDFSSFMEDLRAHLTDRGVALVRNYKDLFEDHPELAEGIGWEPAGADETGYLAPEKRTDNGSEIFCITLIPTGKRSEMRDESKPVSQFASASVSREEKNLRSEARREINEKDGAFYAGDRRGNRSQSEPGWWPWQRELFQTFYASFPLVLGYGPFRLWLDLFAKDFVTVFSQKDRSLEKSVFGEIGDQFSNRQGDIFRDGGMNLDIDNAPARRREKEKEIPVAGQDHRAAELGQQKNGLIRGPQGNTLNPMTAAFEKNSRVTGDVLIQEKMHEPPLTRESNRLPVPELFSRQMEGRTDMMGSEAGVIFPGNDFSRRDTGFKKFQDEINHDSARLAANPETRLAVTDFGVHGNKFLDQGVLHAQKISIGPEQRQGSARSEVRTGESQKLEDGSEKSGGRSLTSNLQPPTSSFPLSSGAVQPLPTPGVHEGSFRSEVRNENKPMSQSAYETVFREEKILHRMRWGLLSAGLAGVLAITASGFRAYQANELEERSIAQAVEGVFYAMPSEFPEKWSPVTIENLNEMIYAHSNLEPLIDKELARRKIERTAKKNQEELSRKIQELKGKTKSVVARLAGTNYLEQNFYTTQVDDRDPDASLLMARTYLRILKRYPLRRGWVEAIQSSNLRGNGELMIQLDPKFFPGVFFPQARFSDAGDQISGSVQLARKPGTPPVRPVTNPPDQKPLHIDPAPRSEVRTTDKLSVINHRSSVNSDHLKPLMTEYLSSLTPLGRAEVRGFTKEEISLAPEVKWPREKESPSGVVLDIEDVNALLEKWPFQHDVVLAANKPESSSLIPYALIQKLDGRILKEKFMHIEFYSDPRYPGTLFVGHDDPQNTFLREYARSDKWGNQETSIQLLRHILSFKSRWFSMLENWAERRGFQEIVMKPLENADPRSFQEGWLPRVLRENSYHYDANRNLYVRTLRSEVRTMPDEPAILKDRDFLWKTLQGLGLESQMAGSPIQDIRPQRLHLGLKTIDLITLENKRGSIAQFILHHGPKRFAENYRKVDQYLMQHPEVDYFPRLGAIQPDIQDAEQAWWSVEYIGIGPEQPFLAPDPEMALKAFLEMAKSGWAILDPKPTQWMVSPGKLTHAKSRLTLLDLDSLYTISNTPDDERALIQNLILGFVGLGQKDLLLQIAGQAHAAFPKVNMMRVFLEVSQLYKTRQVALPDHFPTPTELASALRSEIRGVIHQSNPTDPNKLLSQITALMRALERQNVFALSSLLPANYNNLPKKMRLELYKNFIDQKAAALTVQMQSERLSWTQMNQRLVRSAAASFKSFYEKKNSFDLANGLGDMLQLVFQWMTPYTAHGSYQDHLALVYSLRPHVSWAGLLPIFLLHIDLAGPLWALSFLLGSWFYLKFFWRADGHELTHVLQRILVEEARQNLNSKLGLEISLEESFSLYSQLDAESNLDDQRDINFQAPKTYEIKGILHDTYQTLLTNFKDYLVNKSHLPEEQLLAGATAFFPQIKPSIDSPERSEVRQSRIADSRMQKAAKSRNEIWEVLNNQSPVISDQILVLNADEPLNLKPKTLNSPNPHTGLLAYSPTGPLVDWLTRSLARQDTPVPSEGLPLISNGLKISAGMLESHEPAVHPALQGQDIILGRHRGQNDVLDKRHVVLDSPQSIFHIIHVILDSPQLTLNIIHVILKRTQAFTKDPELTVDVFEYYLKLALAGNIGAAAFITTHYHKPFPLSEGLAFRGGRNLASAAKSVKMLESRSKTLDTEKIQPLVSNVQPPSSSAQRAEMRTHPSQVLQHIETIRAEAAIEQKMNKIDEVMSATEATIQREKGNDYGPKGNNFQYFGTPPDFGRKVMRELEAKGLMRSDKKFADIGAGLGRMLAYALVLTDIGEVIGIEPDPYLLQKGKESIARLHALGVLNQNQVTWVQKSWSDATEELRAMSAAYLYSPLHDGLQINPDNIRESMRQDAFLYASAGQSGWGKLQFIFQPFSEVAALIPKSIRSEVREALKIPRDARENPEALVDLAMTEDPDVIVARLKQDVRELVRGQSPMWTGLKGLSSPVPQGTVPLLVWTDEGITVVQNLAQDLKASLSKIQNPHLSLATEDGATKLESQLSRTALLKLLSEYPGLVSEVAWKGNPGSKIPTDFRKQLENLGAELRKIDPARTFVPINRQAALPMLRGLSPIRPRTDPPILVRTWTGLKGLSSPVPQGTVPFPFLPLTQTQATDPILADFVNDLRSVAALHLADLITSQPELLKGNRSELRQKLLERLAVLGANGQNIIRFENSGSGFLFDSSAAKIYLSAQIERLTARSA